MSDQNQAIMVALTADIAAAYVSGNTVPGSDLAGLIKSIHEALTSVATGASTPPAAETKTPAVPIRRSVTPDAIICLEDGRKFKSLKRHLQSKYNLSPEAYRAKWRLPSDYPMVAPNYAAARSALAKNMGLGQKGRQVVKKARGPRATTRS